MRIKKQQLVPCMEKLIGSRVEKGVDRGVCCHPVYFEHIRRNARLDELQAGIKRGRRTINYLSCVDDTTLMAESDEELTSLLMRVKEESERAGLKLNIKKN